MEINSIILRYGEIGLKSDRNRAFFEKLYLRAIRASLENYKPVDIVPYGKRFTIHHKQSNEFIEILNKIPGIQSFSPAHHFQFETFEDIQKEAEILKPFIKDKTFRITTKRDGKHEFTSMDVSQRLGQYLEPFSKGVSLKQPEVTLFIEIRKNNCYFYIDSVQAMGGLPPTSAGKVLAMFSGGIDSPIAAYEVLKRGCTTDFIYINMLESAPFNDMARVYNELLKYTHGYTPKFYVVNIANLIPKLKEEVKDSSRQIFLKIIFYKISQIIAKRNKHLAIVTGEALSQKSSQTVHSLSVINSQTDMLVMRPLIGLDKIEITKKAREIGTFKFSEKVKEYCNLSEGPVITNPTKFILEQFPDFSEEIEKACKEVIVFKGKLPISEEGTSFKDFEIIDIRSEEHIKNKPLKSQHQITYPEIFHQLENLDKTKNYLIICEHGVRSYDVASRMKELGFKVFAKSVKQFLKEDVTCESV